jgi:hypothetical protein
MKTRRTRKLDRLNQNLDSFLDTLTNTVGVLMFVSLFVSLIAVQAGKTRTTVVTPLVTETNKKPRFFELAANKVTYIDDASIDRQIEKVLGESSCRKPQEPATNEDMIAYNDYMLDVREYQLCLSNQAERLTRFRPSTPYYQARLVDRKASAWLYEPVKDKQGEAIANLAKKNSEFNLVLAKLDPSEDYLAMIVRPDSFEAFRQARELAWKQGFKVGWEPQNSGVPIIFGSGGRNIGIQ